MSVWTAPNLLCLARLAAAPAVAALILVADLLPPGQAAGWLWAALGVFALAAATDAVDGWLARKTGAVSAFGAALDHAADKALAAGALIALCVAHLPMDLIAASVIIILRDLAVAGLREGLAQSGRAVPVSGPGKAKTVAEMAGIAAALAGVALAHSGATGAPLVWLEFVARAALWTAATLAAITFARYLGAAAAPPRAP